MNRTSVCEQAKALGNALFKAGKNTEALDAYTNGLELVATRTDSNVSKKDFSEN